MRLILVVSFLMCCIAFGDVESMNLRLGASVDYLARSGVNPGGYEWNPAWGLEAGLETSAWALLGEWRLSRQSSDEGSLSISTEENQFLIWGRVNLVAQKTWNFWAQVGAGERFARVKSKINQTTVETRSDGELTSGLGLGIGWNWNPEWRFDLIGKSLKPQQSRSWETGATLGISRIF